MVIESISYGVTAFAYSFFLALLLADKEHIRNKMMLIIAVAFSVVWSLCIILIDGDLLDSHVLNFTEISKSLLWCVVIMSLMTAPTTDADGRQAIRPLRTVKYPLSILPVSLLIVVLLDFVSFEQSLVITLYLILAVISIALLEQFYRNTPDDQKWIIKYLCLGLLGSFLYNFYMFSEAMLYQRIDEDLWQARGFVEAMLLPLVAYSVMKDPFWSPDIFISRRVVFHTTTLLASAVYLFVMGLAGYYVKEYGGTWGGVIQALLFFATLLVLAVVLASRRVRAKIRVLLNKHFYPYKYDYREEWLRLIRTISTHGDELYKESIRSIAQIIESPGGLLWLNTGNSYYECVQGLDIECVEYLEPSEGSLPRFIRDHEFVINVDEYRTEPDVYLRLGVLELPPWVEDRDIWLIVPLINIDQLVGFIALTHSNEHKEHFNWEDSDLLKTASRQVASYISQHKISVALAEARQFENFNKLSTYIVHDIKNLVAQLSLIISNADKHKDNPLFMQDAMRTIENTVLKMNKMMDAVSGKSVQANSHEIDIISLLEEVVHMREKSGLRPVPILGAEHTNLHVKADRNQLMSIFGHIIQNAQDATDDDGTIKVLQSKDSSGMIEITITDSGSGMDDEFIRTHLYAPFKSTKGKGMGIGVYETKEILSALGGSIDVRSEVGVGTCFTIKLPPVSR